MSNQRNKAKENNCTKKCIKLYDELLVYIRRNIVRLLKIRINMIIRI